jgi:acetyl/propionyl-CoA carboxylase alpha subunit
MERMVICRYILQEILDRSRGCAIEARIYAENPLKDFLPAAGTITHMQIPSRSIEFTHEMTSSPSSPEYEAEQGVRVDSGVATGSVVSTFYDPMIAKLIAYAETRDDAIAKLERSLRNFQVCSFPH